MMEKVFSVNKNLLLQKRCLFWKARGRQQCFQRKTSVNLFGDFSNLLVSSANRVDKLTNLKVCAGSFNHLAYNGTNVHKTLRKFSCVSKDRNITARGQSYISVNMSNQKWIFSSSHLSYHFKFTPSHGSDLSQKKLLDPYLVSSNIISRLLSTVKGCDNQTKSIPPQNTSDVTVDRLQIAPKNVLHNAYDIIAQQLKNTEFKLQPTYTMIKGKGKSVGWNCTYHVKWPEQLKFTSTGQTKQEASHKAALGALLWLQKNEKITKEGFPIIIQKNELQEITKQTQPTLALDTHTIQQMQQIADLYKSKFVPVLTENMETQTKYTPEMDNIMNLETVNKNLRKRLLTTERYFAKEKTVLPISKYKKEFINLLRDNRIVIIKGEPGCGKSTRIPQYVLESWAREGLAKGEPCQIAVTQPRRIAAISLADRVSFERDESCGQIVGYQIRLKSNFNPAVGRILYCTTGILLKHLQSDINLSNFTHIILDEAHERDVNTDLLLNILKSTLETNSKLKLIVMSATVDIDLFKKYLNDPPVMHIPGFTYPVKSYFLDDFKNLNLSKSFSMAANNNETPGVVHEDVVKLIEYIHQTKKEGAILCFLPGWEDITKIDKLIPRSNDMTVLCLHSRLQDSDQRKIFSKTPPGVRKVILSTNIAETSVTIDDVVYVIDTGIHKENRFDFDKGVTCIDNYWISQSSMSQRKGRAGRVQPGESFHLYPKSKYESFAKFSDPEILKTSLTKIVLNSKVYSNNMDALEFMSQLPSPPEKNSTRRAVRELKDLKLLDDSENLTSLGRTLANFQLEPKLGKILVNSVVYKCVTPVVDIVTIFSSDTELFSSALVDKAGIKRIKSQGSRHSDHLAMMRLFEAWLELMEESGEQTAMQYCSDANLVYHKLITLSKLRNIHFDYLRDGLYKALPIADDYSDNDELVKAILFSGVGNLLRHRKWDFVKGRHKKANIFLTNYNQKATITSDSVNFKGTSFPSEFLIYFNEVRSNIRRTTVVRESSVISPVAVLLFSDKELITREYPGESDKLVLSLKDTKVEFSCLKDEALHIQQCKEALDTMYQYFIFQMTEGGECNLKINDIWDEILQHVNSILLKHSIK